MYRGLKLSLFSKNDLERLHAFGLEVMAKNGISFTGRALEYFKKNGFRIEGNQVFFTQAEVENALKSCPSSFVLKGRESKYDLEIGTGKDHGVPGPLGPVNVSCLEKGIRPGSLEDISNFTKIYHSSEIINITSNTLTEANDIPMENRHLYVQYEVLKHSSKPFCSKVLDFEKTNHVLDMAEIALGGLGSFAGNAHMSMASAPSLSPLSWEETVCDCLIACALRGQVVSVGTGLTTGITAPARIFGTLVMQNAELLAGIVLTQLVNPGNPVLYGTGGMPGNMRGARYNCGSPSRMLIETGTIELGKFYNIPTRCVTFGTESKTLDIQCGIESYEGTLANILGGADYMLSEIGTTDSLITTSYEKTIIDEEIASRLLHLKKGIEVTDDAASLDVIYEVGSGGAFLTTEDTLLNYDADWYCSVTDWNITDSNQSFEYVLQRANREWKKRLENAPESTLSPDVGRELKNYINKIIK